MKYLIGSKKDFIKFINEISDKDKIGIFSHKDLDGFASAFFIEKILETKGIRPIVMEFLYWERGILEKTIEFLKKKKLTKLFVLDINVGQHLDEFMELRKSFDTFFIDHHVFDESMKGNGDVIMTSTRDPTSLVLYGLCKDYLKVSDFDWLVCAAMISDSADLKKENLDFILKIYPASDPSSDGLRKSIPGMISAYVSGALAYFPKNPMKVYKLLKDQNFDSLKKYNNVVQKEIDRYLVNFKKDAEYFSDKNLYFYYTTPKYNITSIITTILSKRNPAETFIFVSDLNKERIKVSARHQEISLDMVKVLEKATNGLKDAFVGGHKPAAGGTFRKADLAKFKENLLK